MSTIRRRTSRVGSADDTSSLTTAFNDEDDDELTLLALRSRSVGEKTMMSIAHIFYTQDSIAPVFHNGKPVIQKNIDKRWPPMVVTKMPNGQWFTLNNRTLFAHKKTLWANYEDNSKNVIYFEVNVTKIPYSDVKNIFNRKYTTKTNGNECRIRGDTSGRYDWTCAAYRNREEYYRFVLRKEDPKPPQWYKIVIPPEFMTVGWWRDTFMVGLISALLAAGCHYYEDTHSGFSFVIGFLSFCSGYQVTRETHLKPISKSNYPT